MSTLTLDNKDFSNSHSPRSKRRYLIALRIRGLREDLVAELSIEVEREYRTLLKHCIDSLDMVLAHYDGEVELRAILTKTSF
jgi:hypothetical protein